PAPVDDFLEHRLTFFVDLACLLADDLVVENGRELAEQAPGLEEWRPVKKLDDLGQIVVLEGAAPKELGAGRRVAGPVNLRAGCTCLGQADQRCGLAIGM